MEDKKVNVCGMLKYTNYLCLLYLVMYCIESRKSGYSARGGPDVYYVGFH